MTSETEKDARTIVNDEGPVTFSFGSIRKMAKFWLLKGEIETALVRAYAGKDVKDLVYFLDKKIKELG